jgi:hypothetical protein
MSVAFQPYHVPLLKKHFFTPIFLSLLFQPHPDLSIAPHSPAPPIFAISPFRAFAIKNANHHAPPTSSPAFPRIESYGFQCKSARHEVKKKLVFPKGKQAMKRSFELESVSSTPPDQQNYFPS